jgi:hypothetical protein
MPGRLGVVQGGAPPGCGVAGSPDTLRTAAAAGDAAGATPHAGRERDAARRLPESRGIADRSRIDLTPLARALAMRDEASQAADFAADAHVLLARLEASADG